MRKYVFGLNPVREAVFLMLFVLTVHATTNMWYPSTSATFSGWPTNWVAMPSLNDPKELTDANARLDFVGDSFNPGAYWSSDSNYFCIRMRVAVSNVTSATFRDSHWIYIDRVGFTNGAAAADMPDYAIAWDTQSNDPTKHGLEVMTGTNLTAKAYWSQMSLNDMDGSNNQKIAPPDLNTSGDGYIRTIDLRKTTNFGYTTFIDFAVKWSALSASTVLKTNQVWHLQFGSRNNANDHGFPQDDVAGGFSPSSVVTSSWSSVVSLYPLSSAISLSAYATSGGSQIDLWTTAEAGRGDIVVYAWLNSAWVEVGRVASKDVVGEGDNHYTLQGNGLAEGSSYLFKVVDEVGHEFILAEPIPVKSLRMAAVKLDLQMMNVTFNTESGRMYQVKVSDNPAAPAEAWATEAVMFPVTNGWSPLSDEPFTAGPGTETQVRIPVNKTRAFYKIVRVN
jgi:hypothetical protein